MIDWNRVMAEALEKLSSSPKKLKKKKKVLKQMPSKNLQDELEPITYNENDIKNSNV